MKRFDYLPYSGFYDLRAFDIPNKEFMKLWNIQRFLYRVESERKQGKMHPQIQEIRDFSAKYQDALSQYPVINESLI